MSKHEEYDKELLVQQALGVKLKKYPVVKSKPSTNLVDPDTAKFITAIHIDHANLIAAETGYKVMWPYNDEENVTLSWTTF